MSDTQESSQAQETTPQGNATQPPAQEPANTPEPQQATSVDQLPEWAQKEIRTARDEAAKYRTKAKSAAETAAEEAQAKAQAERDALIQSIGKQLGFVEEETTDSEALIKAAVEREQAAAKQRDELQEQLNTYRRNDAVRTAVSKVDGQVDTDLLSAVLNSDNAYTQLDVDADDFETQVAQIVTNKIESHPSLVQATHKASGVDTSNTQRGAAKQLTREDLKSMTATEINKAVREGRVANLMKN
ncbi:hypothetical protein ACL1NM_11700 [Corynebacterium striatum]